MRATSSRAPAMGMGNTAGAASIWTTAPHLQAARDGKAAELQLTEEQSHVFKPDIFNHSGCKHVCHSTMATSSCLHSSKSISSLPLQINTSTSMEQYGELPYQSSSQGFRENSN